MCLTLLTLLLKKTIDDGCTQQDWKKAFNSAMSMKRSRNKAENYRPVNGVSMVLKMNDPSRPNFILF